MTSRERFLKALRHQIPDRVPCCPDISIMIRLKLKKRPFWDFFLGQDRDNRPYLEKGLMHAYIDAVRYFGIEGWVLVCSTENSKRGY